MSKVLWSAPEVSEHDQRILFLAIIAFHLMAEQEAQLTAWVNELDADTLARLQEDDGRRLLPNMFRRFARDANSDADLLALRLTATYLEHPAIIDWRGDFIEFFETWPGYEENKQGFLLELAAHCLDWQKPYLAIEIARRARGWEPGSVYQQLAVEILAKATAAESVDWSAKVATFKAKTPAPNGQFTYVREGAALYYSLFKQVAQLSGSLLEYLYGYVDTVSHHSALRAELRKILTRGSDLQDKIHVMHLACQRRVPDVWVLYFVASPVINELKSSWQRQRMSTKDRGPALRQWITHWDEQFGDRQLPCLVPVLHDTISFPSLGSLSLQEAWIREQWPEPTPFLQQVITTLQLGEFHNSNLEPLAPHVEDLTALDIPPAVRAFNLLHMLNTQTIVQTPGFLSKPALLETMPVVLADTYERRWEDEYAALARYLLALPGRGPEWRKLTIIYTDWWMNNRNPELASTAELDRHALTLLLALDDPAPLERFLNLDGVASQPFVYATLMGDEWDGWFATAFTKAAADLRVPVDEKTSLRISRIKTSRINALPSPDLQFLARWMYSSYLPEESRAALQHDLLNEYLELEFQDSAVQETCRRALLLPKYAEQLEPDLFAWGDAYDVAEARMNHLQMRRYFLYIERLIASNEAERFQHAAERFLVNEGKSYCGSFFECIRRIYLNSTYYDSQATTVDWHGNTAAMIPPLMSLRSRANDCYSDHVDELVTIITSLHLVNGQYDQIDSAFIIPDTDKEPPEFILWWYRSFIYSHIQQLPVHERVPFLRLCLTGLRHEAMQPYVTDRQLLGFAEELTSNLQQLPEDPTALISFVQVFFQQTDPLPTLGP